MSKLAFFSIPAYGHTNPTLAVVRELVDRGHQVWYCSFEPYRQAIEDAGGQFISLDAFLPAWSLSARESSGLGSDLRLSITVLVDTTLALMGPTLQHMEALHPDCIVGDSMAPWARLAARKLGIPFVSSTTTFAFNRYSARIMPRPKGELWAMLRDLPALQGQVRRLRKAGLPIRSFLELIQNDSQTPTLVYTSPEFQPRSETFPAQYAFVGPSIRPITDPFQKQRTPLIYISMGTVLNDMLPLYRSCVEALRNLDAQVILSVGSAVAPADLGPLPDHITAYRQVDQIAVLEQADLFLSHCGMNSVNESLYFGVPLVMLPQTAEQQGVAARTAQLGAGLLLTQTTPEAISAAVQTVLCQPDYRRNALEISRCFHRCSGPGGAADHILSFCLTP